MADNEPDEGLVTIVVGDDHPGEPVDPAVGRWETDPVCADAVDLARAALLEEADATLVGEHCGIVADGPLVVTHLFAGLVPGYAGWRWAVTVTRAPDSQTVTIDETALLPDGDALLAPAWVPWKKRIQPGDLGAGDVLVTEAGDPRLVPGFAGDEPDDEQLRPVHWELGLDRVRVLSPEGRREAAQRWYREVGPRSSTARASDLTCRNCGFFLLIGGPLGQAFGVCANGYSPADGRVVANTFGCGAHSETTQRPVAAVSETVVDDSGYDEVGTEPEAEPAPEEQSPAEEDSAQPEPEPEPEAQDDQVPADPAAQPDEPQPDPIDVSDQSSDDGSPSSDQNNDPHATMQEPETEEDS